MPRRIPFAFNLLGLIGFLACAIACGGGGPGGSKESHSSAPDRGDANAEEPPSKSKLSLEQRWQQVLKEERANRVVQLQQQLDKTETEIKDAKAAYKKSVDGQLGYSKQQEKKKAIEEATSKRDRLQNQIDHVDRWEPRLDPEQMYNGSLGKLGVGDNGLVPVFKVIQVIDSRNMLLEHNRKNYWVKMETHDLRVDDNIMLNGLVECVGEKQYESLTGLRTVPVLIAYGSYAHSQQE